MPAPSLSVPGLCPGTEGWSMHGHLTVSPGELGRGEQSQSNSLSDCKQTVLTLQGDMGGKKKKVTHIHLD